LTFFTSDEFFRLKSQKKWVFQQAVRGLRRRKGVNQTELALEFDRTQTWCARLERGAVPVDDAMFARLLSAIDRIAARKEAIAKAQFEAAERVARDFEIPKIQADAGR
jgi:predicted transcriptional regulator